MHFYRILFSVFIIFAAVSNGFAEGEKKQVDLKKLFQQKCSQCHSINRPKSLKKNKAEWTKTVKKMQKKSRSAKYRIYDNDSELIIGYLVENYGK